MDEPDEEIEETVGDLEPAKKSRVAEYLYAGFGIVLGLGMVYMGVDIILNGRLSGLWKNGEAETDE